MGPVALIVVRVIDVERVARRIQRRAERALWQAAHRILRANDIVAVHDNVFYVALCTLESSRSRDAHGVCERLVSAMRSHADLELESGWTFVGGRRDAQALLDAAHEGLQRGRRTRERNDLLAAVGHELRTPLTSIRGYIETVLDEHAEPGHERRFLLTAAREAKRLSRFVDGLLACSLLDIHGDVEIGDCDLLTCVDAACDIVTLIAQSKEVRIISRPLPRVCLACPEDAVVRILNILLENAIKYGAQPGTIRIEARVIKEHLLLQVEDDGPGIAEGDEERIFAPVQRGRTARGVGCGLGLTIAKTLVEQCGGEIHVGRSQLGGASFRVGLAIKAEAVANTSNLPNRETSAYATLRRSDDRGTRSGSR